MQEKVEPSPNTSLHRTPAAAPPSPVSSEPFGGLGMAILVATVGLIPVVASGRCIPKGMVRIETANMTPRIPQGSFASKPRVLYRAGRLFARIEEARDTEHGIHGLIVVHAPDSWLVNLDDRTGQHIVDPDPEPGVRTMVFQSEEMPSDFPTELSQLEFGCEVSFFSELKAEQTPHEAGGRKLTKHVATKGIWRLTMLTEPGDSRPQALLLSQHDKVVVALKYISYRENQEIDLKLFEKPPGIAFQEAGRAPKP